MLAAGIQTSYVENVRYKFHISVSLCRKMEQEEDILIRKFVKVFIIKIIINVTFGILIIISSVDYQLQHLAHHL